MAKGFHFGLRGRRRRHGGGVLEAGVGSGPRIPIPFGGGPRRRILQVIAIAIVLVLLLVALLNASTTPTSRPHGPSSPDLPVEATLRCDPECNVNVKAGPFGTNEPSVAISPTNPLNIVGGANDYNTPNGDAWLGVYASDDAGRTWQTNLIPGYPGCGVRDSSYPLTECLRSPLYGFQGAGDAVVAFDSNGAVYASGIAFKRVNGAIVKKDSAIFVAKSTDGGHTWPASDVHLVIVALAPKQVTFHDKEWMAVDPTDGTIYLTWTIFNAFAVSNIVSSHSSNGGATWSRPVVVSELSSLELQVQGSYLQVDDKGTVHVTWIDFGANKVRYSRSTDKGVSFSAVRDISDVQPIPGSPSNGTYRTPTLPQLAVDRYPTSPYYGSVYVIWNDARLGDADIFMVTSRDGGDSWGDAARVNIDPMENGADQFFPSAYVSPQGYLHVMFYDRSYDSNNTLLSITYGLSFNGGQNLSISFNATDVQFDGNGGGGSRLGQIISSGGAFIGDYLNIAATNDTAYMLWCDTRNGSPSAHNSDLYGAAVNFTTVGDVQAYVDLYLNTTAPSGP